MEWTGMSAFPGAVGDRRHMEGCQNVSFSAWAERRRRETKSFSFTPPKMVLSRNSVTSVGTIGRNGDR